MNTQQQTNEQLPIPRFISGSFGFSENEQHGVKENNSWQRVEQPWKSNYQHPCADGKLGEFLYSETVEISANPRRFETHFHYENAVVIWNADKQWAVVMLPQRAQEDSNSKPRW